MRKIILLPAFFIITFLLISNFTFAPDSSERTCIAEFSQSSKQFNPPSETERWQKEREEYLRINRNGSGLRTESYNIELVGSWPYGSCEALAFDATTQNIALIGNGETLQVVDISDPSSPSLLGETHLQAKPCDIALSGDYAYVVCWEILYVVDISVPSSPDVRGTVEFQGNAESIEVTANYAYVTAGWEGLLIFDISNPDAPCEVGSYYAGGNVVDVALYGNYALIINKFWEGPDWKYQLRIIDVSYYSSPSLKGTYDGEFYYEFTGVDASDTGYAYISQRRDDHEESKLTIIDVATDPANPIETGSYTECHRPFSDLIVSGIYAYLYDHWHCNLEIIDISNPSSPFYFGDCGANCLFNDFHLSGDYIGMSHLDGFSFYNVSDPSNTIWVGTYDTPSQISWTGNPIIVSSDYVFMAHLSDGLLIMDVSTPSNPTVVGQCDDFWADRDLAISGNYAYVLHSGGLHVVDISSPPSPSKELYFYLPWDPRDIAVWGNYAYISGMENRSGDNWANLSVVDISDPLNPSYVGYWVSSTKSGHHNGGIAVSGNYVYLAIDDYSSGGQKAALKIIDVSNPISPYETGSYWTSWSWTRDLAIRENYAYLSGEQFSVIDISDPTNPSEISTYPDCCNEAVALSGNYAYVDKGHGLSVIDISDSHNLSEAGYYGIQTGHAVAVTGNYAYVAGSLYVLRNTLAPEVSITSPAPWAIVAGGVTIEAQASHSSGIAYVKFYIDDVLYSVVDTPPYSYGWDLSPEKDGPHKIRVRAYNNDGNSSDAEIVVTVSNYRNLTISSAPGGTTEPIPSTYPYLTWTDVSVEAIPDSGYEFSGWTGDVPLGQEMDNPVTITVDADKSLTANFTITPGNYELIINPGLGGTTTPEPGFYSYAPGAEVSVTSLPNTGNSFLYWSGDAPLGHEYDNPLSITLDSNKSITPHFSFGGKLWTFMVYMDGDNDYEGDEIDDFLDMAMVGSDENINIVVQFDRRDGFDNRYGDWTSTKRFYVTKGMTPLPENALQDLGELNHGDPQTLTDFVSWAKETYPASHYALIFRNHGEGWRKSKEALRQEKLQSQKELNFKAVCWDDTNGSDSLLMDEVQTALSSCGGVHLIGFDASKMGMVEVAYEIRDCGEVMVGSEEDEPGDGWPYDTILQDLANNPYWSNSEFGSAIVDRYYEAYGSNYTLSAVDLNNMNTLASTISSFAQAMIDNWNTDKSAVKSAAQAVMTEIENTVIHVQQGPAQQNAHGLTIYFPEISGEFDSDYNGTIIDFPNDTQWEEFLQAFYISMGDSWIEHRRAGSQQFGTSQYVDLYHFCELLNTEPRDYYTNNQILHEYVGGGTAQNWQAEDNPLSYTLPFDFPFFEEVIPAGKTIYISPNGFVDFEGASYDRWNSASKLANNKRIAPCWTALWTDGSAQASEDIYITENPDNLVIRWVAETFDTPHPVNIELILRDNGQIQFNYDGGNADFSDQPPTIGISKGDGLHFYFSVYNRQTALTDVDSDVYTPISDSEPYVSITSPADGENVSGTVSIQADASDDNQVTQVEFYIDDELQALDAVFPYSWDWDTRLYSNGPHTIKAIAYDNIGQTDEHQISVTVNNYFLTLNTTTGGITDPAAGEYAYADGEVVSITAIASSGYDFSGWTGDVPPGQESANPITITMDADKSITASFTPFAGYYELMIDAGEGGTTDPAPGAYSHPNGTGVTITAFPDDGYAFNGWSGNVPAGQEMNSSITITVDANKSITASFIVQHTLTIDSDLGGSTDPSPGEYAYNTGTEVSVTANPDSGFDFSGWSGDVPPGQEMENPVTVIMDMNKSISVNFTVEEGNRELIINVVQGEGTTTPAAGAYSHPLGTEVSISASPDAGGSFLYWTGDIPQGQWNANPLTVTMNRARTINAHFSNPGDYYVETQIPHDFIGGGTAQNFKAGDAYMTYTLPFDFPYFSEIIPAGTVICVPTKGFIDFAVLTYDYSNTVSELISNKRIAIFWEDLRTNGSAQPDEDIYITENPDSLIIRWVAETFSYAKPVNVELILYTDGRIQFNYNGGNDLSGISWYPTIGISIGDGVKYNLSMYNTQRLLTNVESILFTPVDMDYPPSVSITSPANGEIVSGIVNIQVSASDNNQVTRVEFYIDDELQSTDVTTPYTWSWDTTTASNGTHEIKAIAYDNLGQPTTHTISVDVANPLLTISVTSGGTTDPEPGVSHSYVPGANASVTAYPDSGYEFNGWSGDAMGLDNPLTINMDGDKNITANFAVVASNYELTIATGSGGTTDPVPGAYSHPADTQVTITAHPDNGYAFNGWTGNVPAGQEMDNPITITMNATKSITANFIQLYTLNLCSERGGTTNPAPGNYSYHSGSLVSITAIPTTGYAFNGWTGDVPAGQENTNPLSLTMDEDKSLTANFALVPGNQELTINSPIRGTTIPAPGSYSYNQGTEVTVTATPDSGYQFAYWSGDIPPGHEADNPVSITLDDNKSITANFRVVPGNYELIINQSYGGTTNPAPGEYPYTGGTEVSITGIPDGGASFVQWTGDVPEGHEDDNPLSLTMNANRSITPLFTFPGEYYTESHIPVEGLSQGTARNIKGDDIILIYELPFDFPFYGEYIPAGTEIFICTNGFIDFEAPFVDWTNTLEEFITHRRIAPLWKDLKTSGSAQPGEDIYITENIDNLIIRWAAETFPGGEPVNVEVILYNDGKIQFNYGDGNSLSGTPPTIGLSRGDGLKFNVSSYNGQTTLTFCDSDLFTPTGLSDNPPYIMITSPSDGETVGGMVEIQASASDDKEVSRVEFFINSELISRDTTAPYSCSWNTIPRADGSYPAIQVVAYDSISQTADHEISVTIDNYHLSIGITPGGTTDPPPGIYTYGPGAEVTVTAIPNTASYYIFNGWTGSVPAGHEMDNPLTITMDAENKSITATFIKNYELTINSGIGGTTDPSPGTYNYSSVTNVTITATPESGYQFNGWTGDVLAGQEMNNPITINVNANKSITATFSVVPGNYELIINSATGGTTVPASGHYSYSAGTEVSITANPDPNFSFLFWTGDVPWGNQYENPLTITMDSAKTITPYFRAGGDYYIESLIPHEYIGGGTPQNFYEDNSYIAYALPFDFPYFGEVIPAGTNIYICSNGFVNFGTGSSASFNTVSYLINNKRIAPLWEDLRTDGSVQAGEDVYITENADNLIIRWVAQTYSYSEPVNIELVLYADGRIQFNYNGENVVTGGTPPTIGISYGDGFRYNLSLYNGQETFTNVESDLFTPKLLDDLPSVSVTSPSEGETVSGTVNILADASDDNQVIRVEFYVDNELQCVDTESPYGCSWDSTAYPNGPHTIKAVAYDRFYQTAQHEISVNTLHYTLTVSATPGGTTDPPAGVHRYVPGTAAAITAVANSGYGFSGWTGNVFPGQEMDNPVTITMDSNKSITANFSIMPGYYELVISEASGGTTEPSPGAYGYPEGAEVSITAVPDSGWHFLHWTGAVPSGHEKDNPVSITMDSNKTIDPVFVSHSWTFMVYLDGDNNLEGAAIDDFLEMASVGSDDEIHIVVQFDRIDGYDSSYGGWTSTKRFYITSGLTPTADNALQDLGELNHGAPQTLIDFVNWAKENYPAKNYALILWNHGSGWRLPKEELLKQKLEEKRKPDYRAVCWDDTDGEDTLYMDEVQGVLSSTQGAQLIGFDACLMGMVEVAYEIRNYGEFMVGSEEVEPGDGWPYNTILQGLSNNPSWTSSELGQAIVNRYYESYGNDMTQSLIDLTAMESLKNAISSFAQTMIDNWNTNRTAVKSAAEEVKTKLNIAVVQEQHGSDWPGAHGLAIYFPQTSGEYNADYDSVIDFANDTSWEEFLQEFYSSMAGSWLAKRRAITQEFVTPQHVDLYHFCERIIEEPGNYYAESQISHEFQGGGSDWDFNYNDASRTYNLPFDFPFFGEILPAGTTIYVGTNGVVDLVDFCTDPFNSGLKLANNKRIAPFWTDLRTNGSVQSGEDIYVTGNSDNVIIRWVAETVYFGEPVNFELILYNDGRIQFNYGGGNSNLWHWYSGQGPTIGISKGDGINCCISAYNTWINLNNVNSVFFTPSEVPPYYYLTIAASEGGTIDPLPGTYECAFESEVIVTATPNTGFYFSGWTGDVPEGQEMDNPLAITMDADKSLTANFTLESGYWQLGINTTSGGTTDPVPGSYGYADGTEATITAIPNPPAEFTHWSGDVPEGQENENPLSITMDANKSITAHFTYPQTWTFMVYLDGDNNLEGAGIDDFLEIASVGSTDKINIVVQFDRISGFDTRYGNWTSTKRFYITNGLTPDPGNELQDLGELNHGDPQTLVDFVNWAKANYPANNYALILWNHGGGWRLSKEERRIKTLGGSKMLNYRAVCWDATNGDDSLYMEEVRGALDDTGGAELIGFDACFMGMMEVAYEIRNNSEVMVGSEETEPGPGWPYHTILQDLTGNPSWQPSDLGSAIVERYYESYPEGYTQSAIDLRNMNSLADSVNSLADTMINNWDSDQNAVRSSAQEVMSQIENTVLHEQHGPCWTNSSGLAVYFPETSDEFSSEYNGSIIDFARNTQWDEFIQEFYGSMGGSWIAERRAGSQQYVWPAHIDLYHFCELINSDPGYFFNPAEQLPHDFLGGGTGQGCQDDDRVISFSLPFDFPYFGETIDAGTDIYICTNGYVDFANPVPEFSNTFSGLANNKRIAPCWTDLMTGGAAQGGEDIYITHNVGSSRNPDSLVIRWVAEFLWNGEPVNIELILFDNGEIQFNYGDGNTDFGNQPPTIGVSKGDGINVYLSSYDGADSLNNVNSEIFRLWIGYLLTLTAGSGGTTDPEPGVYSYDVGQQVTITAIPATYNDFDRWTGAVPENHESDNPLTVTMDSNKMITANFLRINPPSSFSIKQEFNRSLLIGEYVNVLTWQANPLNSNISEYRIYDITEGNWPQIGTVSADAQEFWHRNVDPAKSYTYALCAVTLRGVVGEPSVASIQGQSGSEESKNSRSVNTVTSGSERSTNGASSGTFGRVAIETTSKEKAKQEAIKIRKPLNFVAQRAFDYTIPEGGYIHVLSWQANPESKSIERYKIYIVEGDKRRLLVELDGDALEYVHREVEQNKPYKYALIAVDKDKRECKPVYAEVK